MIQQALTIAGIGLAVVFCAMSVFYLLIKLLQRLFPYKGEQS